MGTPSHDRVRFFLSGDRIASDPVKFEELLSYAFDANLGQFNATVKEHMKSDAYCGYGATIVCRPSQFARFLIKRNELGLANGFKELHAELFVPQQGPTVLDVSKRTYTYPSSGYGAQRQDEGCQL